MRRQLLAGVSLLALTLPAYGQFQQNSPIYFGPDFSKDPSNGQVKLANPASAVITTKPNDNTVDSLAALNTALASGFPVHIGSNQTYYVSNTLNIPDKASLLCGPGGTIARMPSATATDSRPLVTMTSWVRSKLEGCTIDLNQPARGNWWSGLGPNGYTYNVIVRDVIIKDANGIGGLNWKNGEIWNTHGNLLFDNISVVNSGYFGATLAGMYDGSVINNLKVWSTGFQGINIVNTYDTTLSHPYVNKVKPPTIIYSGPNRWFGDTGGTVSTSLTVPSGVGGTINFTLTPPPGYSVAQMGLNPNGSAGGQFMRIYSQANQANYIGGNLSALNVSTGAASLIVTEYGGSGSFTDGQEAVEGGMMLFHGGNARFVIDSPILDDNRNAASDGLGFGENGTESTTSMTFPLSLPQTVTFVTRSGMVIGPPSRVEAFSRGNPFGVTWSGEVTGVSGNNVTVKIDTAKGPAGTYSDWTMHGEWMGNTTILNPYVYRAGLFGLDGCGKCSVIGGVIEEAAERGTGSGLDLGGMVYDYHVTGLTIKNTGIPPGLARGVGNGVTEPTGIFWGGAQRWSDGSSKLVRLNDISYVSTTVIDTRNPPLTALGQNVDLAATRAINITFDVGLIPPFGTAHSYNTFGEFPQPCGSYPGNSCNMGDPHLDGSWVTWNYFPSQLQCYNASNTNTGSPQSATTTISTRGGMTQMYMALEIDMTTLGAGCAGATAIQFPLPNNFVTNAASRQTFAATDELGQILSGYCDPNSAYCRVTAQNPLANGHVYIGNGILNMRAP